MEGEVNIYAMPDAHCKQIPVDYDRAQAYKVMAISVELTVRAIALKCFQAKVKHNCLFQAAPRASVLNKTEIN